MFTLIHGYNNHFNEQQFNSKSINQSIVIRFVSTTFNAITDTIDWSLSSNAQSLPPIRVRDLSIITLSDEEIVNKIQILHLIATIYLCLLKLGQITIVNSFI